MEPHDAAHVLDAGTASTTGREGDRDISRHDVSDLSRRTSDSPDDLRDLFVAVMIWGSGTTNGGRHAPLARPVHDVHQLHARVGDVSRSPGGTARMAPLPHARPSSRLPRRRGRRGHGA
ncbi:8-oxoguanine DNA glycosylase OGG fold protein [Actinacidiphila epipremni]|uniref:8-oxoguanine DNA glycosylase OGG fold protein n=1 Tax=Actinacidiphila epipremni TaxID=2053013 RepID=UPI002AFF405B|nr:hypothetical protein [Actinacidiphila epipremni]